jgi:hypothetical protein
VYFADGSRLEFTERVVIEQRRAVKREYRYQFVSRGKAAFRYDNAPHHPHVATFPHHKHVGSKILPAAEPDFRQALEEALSLVADDVGQPQAATKRRRQISKKAPKKS